VDNNSDNCINCRNRCGGKIYCSKYYSNTIKGIEANIRDGLFVLQDKYTLVKTNNIKPQDGYTKEEIIWMSIVQKYNPKEPDRIYKIGTKLIEFHNGVYGDFDGFDYTRAKLLGEKFKKAYSEHIKLYSPGELRVYDDRENITGLVNGKVKEEISNSIYDNETKTVIILFPTDSYYYEVVGINEGYYGLVVTSVRAEDVTNFTVMEIPIFTNITHQYTINWENLSKGEDESVVVRIDADGDGIIDNEGILSSEFTYEDFLNIILPDFVLAPGDISISNLEPTEGDKVNIRVTIHNYGGVNVSNARIVLYIDDESIDEKNISLPKHSYTTITFIWIATKGSHDIKLSVDPSDEIKEAREDNNQASTSISVKEKEEKRALESVKGILEKGLDIFQSILKKHTLLVIIAIIIMVIIGIGLIVKRK